MPDPAGLGPGQTLAGRYRLVYRLRSPARGEVWRAEDQLESRAVALQIIDAAGDEQERERILQTLRLARSVTHPAVCQVLDVVEADGRIYCSLELVNGESLRTLVRRAGRLSSEKVAEIGRQLSGGVAALVSAGLPTTIDASTVLLSERGAVRILDAGLPGNSDEPPARAVGAILYELLAGSPPATTAGTLAPVSTLVSGVDPQLERVIMTALTGAREARPPSVAHMASALAGVVDPAPADPYRNWMAAIGIVGLVAAVALLVSFLMPGAPAALSEEDTIVLADFQNATGNPVFDGALKVALAVALEQSPFLRVFPDDRARDTLRLMQRPAGERITVGVARDIARREQLKALVAGSVAPLGNRFVISLEAMDAATGGVMARRQVEADAQEDVLRALGTAAAQLRGQLGESLASIERFDTPLPQATTPSLEALNAYALALDEGRVVPRVEAIPHLRRAIELDPGFAMAHAALSGVYRNTGRSADAPEHSRLAFELRDRVSERERFFISWRYYVDASQEWDKALDLSAAWTRTYPREPFAFNSLGLATAAFGDHTQAIEAFREAIRLDPRFLPPHGNLAGSLIAANRFAEAKTLLADASQRGIAFITVRRMAYLLAFIDGDAAAMTRELDLVRRSPDAAWALVWEARTSAFRGDAGAAHDRFQPAVQAALGNGARELAAQWATEDGEIHATFGECGMARQEVQGALGLSRDIFTLERAGRALALCGDTEGVGHIREELTTRFGTATLTHRVQLPVIGAAEALRQGEPRRAVQLLAAVVPYDHAPAAEFWPAYLRGQAYLQLKQMREAAGQFRAILDRRGAAPTSPLYALARRQLALAEDSGRQD